MKKSNLNNQSGFTLVEVMVVAAMMGGLSLVGMQLTKNMSRTQKSLFQKSEMLSLRQQVNSALNDEEACKRSVIGQAKNSPPISIPAIYYGYQPNTGTAATWPKVVSLNSTYGSGEGTVTVTAISFSGYAVGAGTVVGADEYGLGSISMTVRRGTLNGAGAQTSSSMGQLTKTELFPVMLKTTAGVVTGCNTNDSAVRTAACDVVGGTYNTTTSRCDNISITNKTGNTGAPYAITTTAGGVVANDGEIVHRIAGVDKVRIGRVLTGGHNGISIVGQPLSTGTISAAEGEEVATKQWIRQKIYDEFFTPNATVADVATLSGVTANTAPPANATLDMIRRSVCESVRTYNEDWTTTATGSMAPGIGNPCVITPVYCTNGNVCITAGRTLSAAAFAGGTMDLTGGAIVGGTLWVKQTSQFDDSIEIGSNAVIINPNGTIDATNSITSGGNITASSAVTAGTQVTAGSQVCVSGNCNTTFGAHHCDFVGPIRDKMVGYVAGRVECQTSPGNVIYYR